MPPTRRRARITASVLLEVAMQPTFVYHGCSEPVGLEIDDCAPDEGFRGGK